MRKPKALTTEGKLIIGTRQEWRFDSSQQAFLPEEESFFCQQNRCGKATSGMTKNVLCPARPEALQRPRRESRSIAD